MSLIPPPDTGVQVKDGAILAAEELVMTHLLTAADAIIEVLPVIRHIKENKLWQDHLIVEANGKMRQRFTRFDEEYLPWLIEQQDKKIAALFSASTLRHRLRWWERCEKIVGATLEQAMSVPLQRQFQLEGALDWSNELPKLQGSNKAASTDAAITAITDLLSAEDKDQMKVVIDDVQAKGRPIRAWLDDKHANRLWFDYWQNDQLHQYELDISQWPDVLRAFIAAKVGARQRSPDYS